MKQKIPAVYMMANQRNGTLYIGVTSDLITRVWQHKNKICEGFSKLHNTNKLIYYETHDTMYSAITREKQIKKWNRLWKIRLIEEFNPNWEDKYESL